TSCVSHPCSCPHRDLRSFPTRRSSDLMQLRKIVGEPRPEDVRQDVREPGVVGTAGLDVEARPILRDGEGDQVPLPLDVSGKRFRSEEHTSELQSRFDLVCRLLLEKKKK